MRTPRILAFAATLVLAAPAPLLAQGRPGEAVGPPPLPRPAWRGDPGNVVGGDEPPVFAPHRATPALRLPRAEGGDNDWLYPVGGLLLGAVGGAAVGAYRCAAADAAVMVCVPVIEAAIGAGIGFVVGAAMEVARSDVP